MLELKNKLRRFINEGHATHIYFESGFLKEKKPKYRYQYFKNKNKYLFDLASCTKALVTVPLAFQMLYDKKKKLSSEKKKLVYKLLNHQSGFPAWVNFWLIPPTLFEMKNFSQKKVLSYRQKRILEGLEHAELYRDREKKYLYSDVGFILLGEMIEEFYGKRVDELFIKKLLKEKNKNIGFCLNQKNYIPTEYKNIVHDENAQAMGEIAAHAGLFAKGEELGKYIKKLFLSDLGKKIFEKIQKEKNDKEHTHGFKIFNNNFMGHLGFTGTGFWVSTTYNKSKKIEDQIYIVLLTNRVIEGRKVFKPISDLREWVFEKSNFLKFKSKP